MILKAKKPKNVIIEYQGGIPTYYGDCPNCGQRTMIVNPFTMRKIKYQTFGICPRCVTAVDWTEIINKQGRVGESGMTCFEAIGVLNDKFSNVDIGDRSQAEVFQEAFDKARDALIKLDLIKTHGCVVCKMSKEYDCNGCAYDGTEDWKEPCRICRRNQKDYYREAEK